MQEEALRIQKAIDEIEPPQELQNAVTGTGDDPVIESRPALQKGHRHCVLEPWDLRHDRAPVEDIDAPHHDDVVPEAPSCLYRLDCTCELEEQGESTAVIAHSVPSQQCANIVVALLRVGPIEAARGGLVLIRHAKVVHLERNRPLGELLQRHRCLRSPTVICRVVIELCEQVILGFDGSEDQRNAAQTA